MNRIGIWSAVGAIALTLGASLSAQAETYVTFTVPNGTITSVTGINANGDISGGVTIQGGSYPTDEAFIYSVATGIVTTFAYVAPDADNSAASAIDGAGTVVGSYLNPGQAVFHGLVRTPDGTVSSYDSPFNNSGLESYSTVLMDESSSSETLGYSQGFYQGAEQPPLWFILRADGTQTVHYGDSSQGADHWVYPTRINNSDHVIGRFGCCSSFVADASGVMTILSIPYPLPLPFQVLSDINNQGSAVGYGYSATTIYRVGTIYTAYTSFIRNSSGRFMLFNVKSGKRPLPTFAAAINDSGTVVGSYYSSTGPELVQAGFMRAPDGTITAIAVPGMSTSLPSVINSSGVVAGVAYAAVGSSTTAGFVRLP